MKTRLLQHGRLQPALEAALVERYDVHPLWAESDPAEFLARRGHEFVALVTRAAIGADATLINALPALRVISSFGVGLDKIDLDLARQRGIAVGYTPDVLNDAVADTAFGLLIDVARGFSAADRFVRRGEWMRQQYPLATQVSGKRLGIVGLGGIGRVIARRASGFDMEVRYHNRRRATDAPYQYVASIDQLAHWADFLVIASAGGPESRHLVSAAVLDALGPRGFLINISRGTVVDEKALIDALVHRRIAGAGLDVYGNEPNAPEALFPLDNVVLLPHIASATHETRDAMSALVLNNLESFFTTGSPRAAAGAPQVGD